MIRLTLLAALVCVGATAQDTRLTKTPEQVVEHLLGPSAMLRKQALAWAREHVNEVAPLIAAALQKAGPKPPPYEGVRALGEVRDVRVSTALVGLVERPDFPWRPHALEALADHAFAGAAGVFAKGTSSPVSRSRAAACRGIGAIDMRAMEGLLSERLGDEEAAVRLEAAKALALMGDRSGIPIVIKDLSLDRSFAGQDPGAVAREASAAWLKELGCPPELLKPSVADQKTLDDVLSAMRTKVGPAAEKFPDKIPPHEPDAGASMNHAVEVRSCTEGDFFARFDDKGNVVFGRDLLRVYALSPAATAPIVHALMHLDTGGTPRKILGQVSCDFERLATRLVDGGWRTLVIATGKREASFDYLEKAVVEVVRQTRGDVFAAHHEKRIAPFRAAAAESAASAPASRPREGGN